ncbi:MAG TPA: sigma-54 dependent transcriptional regulator [bacterium]|nr:sigma-54 dependent transcriptional regulator [bacterium]
MTEQTQYRVLFIADPSCWSALEPRLPDDPLLAFSTRSFKDLPDHAPDDADLILFGIRASQVRQAIQLKHAWSLKTNTAIIAEHLGAHEVVRLMKAGFSEVFDLEHDIALLREWLAVQYEQRIMGRDIPTDTGNRRPEDRIRGTSPGIRRVRELAIQAAAYPELTVLIQGETGTGKEMVARLIHESSPRKTGPFIEVNCSAIPETLMEAEMLGHEKGAFTDARRAKRGFFELADGGTLFLDEIGVMPPALQNKILKIVEEKKFRRLGGETEIRVDAKIIAGSNVDLKQATENGQFRPDLYYRLKVFNIVIPALRERHSDIPGLAEFFLSHVSARYGLKDIAGFHPATLNLLKQYSWPGNVRELKHVVERASILAGRGRILPNHLPEELQNTGIQEVVEDTGNMPDRDVLRIPLPESGLSMSDIERMVMAEVLRRCDGNQSKTARYLKISRTRLIRKLSE